MSLPAAAPNTISDTLSKRREGTLFRWAFVLTLILLFSQVWWDMGGFTFRLIDLVLLFLLGRYLFTGLLTKRVRFYRSALNVPLLVWSAAILFGALITQLRPVDAADQQDAIINGIRLVLAFSLFFIVSNDRSMSTVDKARTVFLTVIVFSFLTTVVSLLQIAYWAGRLPFSLPAILVQFRENANQEPGREIFALFVGNSGTHVWSAMLAFQALTVWVAATTTEKRFHQLMGLAYFLLLSLILVRTSVRNSILGLVIAVILLSLIRALKSRYIANRLAIPIIVLLALGGGIALLVTFGNEQYFVERLVQAIPRLTGEGIVINRASNIYGRLGYIAAGLTIFSRYPLFGGGYYGYRTYYVDLTRDTTITHAHNSYVQVLAELGLIGALALGWLLWRGFGLLVVAGRNIVHRGIWERRVWYLAISSSFFMLFTAFFANPIWEPSEVAFLMILIALVNRFFWERT
ncbi:MAG TPA: O-antigen ligase family protein [Promineifilum sp.]|nr:O-antigen ligase family protein [Promineifilum sp.]